MKGKIIMGYFSSVIGVTSTFMTEDGFTSVTKKEAQDHIRTVVLEDYFNNKLPDFSENGIQSLVKVIMNDTDSIYKLLFNSIEVVCDEYRAEEDEEDENETEEDC